MQDNEWTRILAWPGYRVYQQEVNEAANTLKLWVRRKRGNRKLVCSGCGAKLPDTAVHEVYQREVRDLPWSVYRATVVVELYRLRCPTCGVKTEKVPLLPSNAPFSKRFEEAVGMACESASARQVARRFKLAPSTVRAIDLRYLERWQAGRRKPVLRQIGVDEIHLGKKAKFVTVVCDLETGEPNWMGRERKQETLDGFFQQELSAFRRQRIEAACVDMWEPYTNSIRAYLLAAIGKRSFLTICRGDLRPQAEGKAWQQTPDEPVALVRVAPLIPGRLGILPQAAVPGNADPSREAAASAKRWIR